MLYRQIIPPNPSFFAFYSLLAAAGVLVRIRFKSTVLRAGIQAKS
jgi:hypothetical protein